MRRVTIAPEQEEATWEALWDRGYDSYELVERLAETALEELAAGETVGDAIGYAERRYGVRPRGQWCPECESGDVGDFWEPGRCEACGTELEVT